MPPALLIFVSGTPTEVGLIIQRADGQHKRENELTLLVIAVALRRRIRWTKILFPRRPRQKVSRRVGSGNV